MTGVYSADNVFDTGEVGVQLLRIFRIIQREFSRANSDEYQHNQTDSFLSVVRSMEEAHQCTGADQDPANPGGGGWFFLGSLNTNFLKGRLSSRRRRNMIIIAIEKPKRGDTSRELNTSEALLQLTPTPLVFSGINVKARPTPRIDPMRVCELELGKPKYHVPRFQMMALKSSAKIIATL